MTVSTLYKLTAQLFKWLSALSLVFQLSAGLEADAGISYGFLNLGCGHIEPAVPDPKGTVHGCPVVWSPLRGGMHVHSSGGESQMRQI